MNLLKNISSVLISLTIISLCGCVTTKCPECPPPLPSKVITEYKCVVQECSEPETPIFLTLYSDEHIGSKNNTYILTKNYMLLWTYLDSYKRAFECYKLQLDEFIE